MATRRLCVEFDDREIGEILGWEPGKPAPIRRRCIRRRAVVISALERMRSWTKQAERPLFAQQWSLINRAWSEETRRVTYDQRSILVSTQFGAPATKSLLKKRNQSKYVDREGIDIVDVW